MLMRTEGLSEAEIDQKLRAAQIQMSFSYGNGNCLVSDPVVLEFKKEA